MLMFNTWVKVHIAIVYEWMYHFILYSYTISINTQHDLYPYNLTSHICDFPVNGLLLF